MKKIKIKNSGSNIVRFLNTHKERLFLTTSVIAALFVGILMYCSQLILYSAIVTSLIVYWQLPYANICINDKIVRAAWACINFSLFIATCKLCSMSLLNGDYYIYFSGIIVAMAVNGFLYSVLIPKLSYKMKFIDYDEKISYYYDQTEKIKYNGLMLHCTVYIIVLLIVFSVESKKFQKIKFEKEPFVSVYSWEKDIYNGDTTYFVKTEKGILVIPQYRYPEIEYINPNTKIKVLRNFPTIDNLLGYSRLEIIN